ncbi:hypothetical protein WN943_014745 [Citrus x changshan-huyou]
MLITSTRSLSVSFQGDAFSLPISKTKDKATPETRRGTPVRDSSVEGKKFVGYGYGAVAKSWYQYFIENESRLSLDLNNAKQNKDGNLLMNEYCDLVTSDDTDSVSSGITHTSGVRESGGAVASRMKKIHIHCYYAFDAKKQQTVCNSVAFLQVLSSLQLCIVVQWNEGYYCTFINRANGILTIIYVQGCYMSIYAYILSKCSKGKP